jgi:hypothetical protein
MRDLFSKGQMESKRWLVNELEKINVPLGTVFLCAGWYGSLAAFLFESNLQIEKIRSFDIDESCASIADTFNRSKTMDSWKFKASTFDILEMKYPLHYLTKKSDGSVQNLVDDPDTIINTSCEHIFDFDYWYEKIPHGKLICLQSNNYETIQDHVNCVTSLEEFAIKTPMSNMLYSGELELPKYTRYMRIGFK